MKPEIEGLEFETIDPYLPGHWQARHQMRDGLIASVIFCEGRCSWYGRDACYSGMFELGVHNDDGSWQIERGDPIDIIRLILEHGGLA